MCRHSEPLPWTEWMFGCWYLGAAISPSVVSLSRAGYRPLLEAGVRVFEWNGSMLHAKTAVADGRWARVGSSNLNVTSWIGNWELDVAVEDEAFAQAMQEMYLEDLTHATEIVLNEKQRVRPSGQSHTDRQPAAGRAVVAPAEWPPAHSASATPSARRSPTVASLARPRPRSWCVPAWYY